MQVVIRSLHAVAPIAARLRDIPRLRVTIAGDDAALGAALPDAELLLISDNLYSAEAARLLREQAPKLAWIQLLSSGYDAAARHGIPPGVVLTNAGDAYAPSVATHAIALLLGLERQFPAFFAAQSLCHWERGLAARNAIPFGATIAVIGFGAIGSEIGRLLRHFGARIVAVTRSGKSHPDADETVAATRLHSILPSSDAVVIALAAGPDSHHLIGTAELSLMKPSAVLVNIARGYVVDCIALADALKAGVIAGAGLDVTEPEPLPADHPLWTAPNVIITPHMAGAAGAVTGTRLAKLVGDNVDRRLAGRPLAHVITL
jgi:phosphoglycerate dehydrogenase-like enzyme